MKIAIIAAHFMPEVGYQEVYLARAFSRQGHFVRVFTSNLHSPSIRQLKKKNYVSGLQIDKEYRYQILRLRPLFRVGANVISKGLKKLVKAFEPDLVVIVGVGKLFPYELVINKSKKYKKRYSTVVLFGDNSDFFNWSSFKNGLKSVKSIVLQKTIKRFLYARAVMNCDQLYLYTPETKQLILSNLPDSLKTKFKNKSIITSLGFDPDDFYFDPADRKIERKNLGITENEVVLITSTRVKSEKRLEHLIDIVSEMIGCGVRIRYIIVGFLQDSYEKELKTYIERKGCNHICHCFGFMNHERIRKLYCAADIGVWLRAAISIQEAMGTGLPIILENKPNVNHLIRNKENGWYFINGTLRETINIAVKDTLEINFESKNIYRERIRKQNAMRLSYDKIAKTILINTHTMNKTYK